MKRLRKWITGAMLCAASGLAWSAEPVRWGEQFRGTYQDVATGLPVSFGIRMPPLPRDSSALLPLVVLLKRGLQVAPSDRFSFIEVKPSVAGIWGYRAMSAVDVMAVINYMKDRYPIDENRVYLVGYSAGASGAMHLASLYPDTFAAVLPLVAMGNDYPLRNFSQLPVAVHHGARDWTSSICNARVQVQKLQKIEGSIAALHEYPAAGHSVPRPHQPIVKWMLDQKRDPTPPMISIDCETPRLGCNRYVQITEFQDPHERATMEVMLDSDWITVSTNNVKSFTLDFDKLDGIKRLTIHSQFEELKGVNGIVAFRLVDGVWVKEESEPRLKRLYAAGAMANLYEGEPLLIVYGTAGKNPDRIAGLRAAAERLAVCGGPVYSRMSHARFPVVADSEVTPEQEAKCNLLLVGTPTDHRIVKKLVPRFPVQIENDHLHAGGREALALYDRVVGMLYPHPDYPSRLVYWLAPFSGTEEIPGEFVNAPQRFLSGPTGFHRIEQADLLVQDFQHAIAREMQLDKNWQWIVTGEGEQKIQSRFADRDAMALVYLEVMKRVSQADFAVWWGPADQGMWGADFNYLKRYRPEQYSRSDFRVKKRVVETMIGEVTGAELRNIEERWISKKELTIVPDLLSDRLDPEKRYRIHIPMDLYIKLGQRKKNLGNPKPGPNISPHQVASEIF